MVGKAFSIPSVTNEDRSKRLIDAGAYWSGRIEEDVSRAALTYKVNGVGVGAVATRLQAGKHIFHIDEPAGLAGDDIAASPVEIALGAFIACQIVVYRLYAQNLEIAIDTIEVAAEGDLDVRGLFGMNEQVRPGFSEIRLTTHITGSDTDDRYAQLQEFVDKNCPVLDLFANPTPVKLSLLANQ